MALALARKKASRFLKMLWLDSVGEKVRNGDGLSCADSGLSMVDEEDDCGVVRCEGSDNDDIDVPTRAASLWLRRDRPYTQVMPFFSHLPHVGFAWLQRTLDSLQASQAVRSLTGLPSIISAMVVVLATFQFQIFGVYSLFWVRRNSYWQFSFDSR